MHPVDSLANALEEHVRYVLSAASSSPPGGGPAWDGVLAHYRVPPFAYDERAASVANLRMARGALPGEVRAVLESLRAWATGEVARLRQDPANAFMPSAPLENRLAALVAAELPRYELAIGLTPLAAAPVAGIGPATAPAPIGPSLGSIFANAQRTSKEVPWAGANQSYKPVASLSCVHCGGPQEQPLDFMCKYCRRPIAGVLKPTT
jgi:hypothetical protein